MSQVAGQRSKVFGALLLWGTVLWGAEAKPEADPNRGYDLPFTVGETITYTVKWGWIHVARTVSTTQWIEEDGRELVQIQFRTKSNNYLRKIYPVDDLIETIMDPTSMRPVRFTKNMSEGRYRTHEVTTFDFDKLEANWKKINKKRDPKTYAINAHTRDLVSFMYSMRGKAIQENHEFKEQVMADEKLYDLTIKTGKLKKMKVGKWGKVECLRIDPEASFEGLFVRKGTMSLWVSNDDRRLVTKMEADTPFANIHLLLIDVDGGEDDRWSQAADKGEDPEDGETSEDGDPAPSDSVAERTRRMLRK